MAKKKKVGPGTVEVLDAAGHCRVMSPGGFWVYRTSVGQAPKYNRSKRKKDTGTYRLPIVVSAPSEPEKEVSDVDAT